MSETPVIVGPRPAPSYQEILKRDRHPAPSILDEHTVDLGVGPVPASNYTSADYFKREVEKVWLKTWQYVCLEAHVPNPGDTYVYDLLNKTVIVTRQADGSLKAFQNVCLHRGRKLVTAGGCKQQFRCPYHGFTWNTDGSFKENPFGWDFPQIDPSNFDLPEIRLGSWGGFVFINFDKDARPLLEMLGPIPEHFERWRIQDCTMVAHVGKMAPSNWKVCSEAFLEAHHIFATHPQINHNNGYESGQHDILTDHVTRYMNPSGLTPSIHHEKLTEDQRMARLFEAGKFSAMKAEFPPEPGMTVRNYAAELTRRGLEASTGYDFQDAAETELLDGTSYDFFPNFHLWGGFRDKICYRFRPIGMDHEKSLFEVMLFRIAPKDQPKPPPAPFHMLGEDEGWTQAPELGPFSGIYDQDQSNMGPVQEGLRALGDNPIQFGRYLEVRLRNLHRMIDLYMQR